MKTLADFSTDELLEEIVRRRNTVEKEEVSDWCDDCLHFRHSTSERDTRNNCTKGHAMLFMPPEDDGDECGFYRRVCADRAARPPPPPPPPPRPRRVK